MPKIEEAINEYKSPSLQDKVLSYLLTHDDEVFSFNDAAQLSMSVNHTGSFRDIMPALFTLYRKGSIGVARLGQLTYFGSKDAISELSRRKKK